jgi:hypothetical protein
MAHLNRKGRPTRVSFIVPVSGTKDNADRATAPAALSAPSSRIPLGALSLDG